MSLFTQDGGCDVAPNSLDLFTVPKNQVAFLKRYYEDIRPISQYHGLNPLVFELNLQGDVYTDLSQSRLYLKCRLLKGDGTSFNSQDNISVTPVNLMFHAMFSEVDVKMNGTIVSSSGSMYPYIAYIHSLLNTSNAEKNSSMTSQLFYEDTPGAIDELDANGGNFGLYQRHRLTKESQLFEMSGPILSDCFLTDRFLLNGIKLDISMKRSSPRFCLTSTENLSQGVENYQVVIEDAYLRLCRIKINPAILVAHSKLLKTVTAKYPYTKRAIRCCNVPPNQTVFHWDHIVESPLPKFIVVGFCASDSLAGSYHKSPWNFIHCDIRQLSLCVNGVSVPADPIDVFFDSDGKNERVLQVFDRFVECSRGTGVSFNRGDISRGYALFLFNLDPDYGETLQFPLLKTGEMSINARMGTPLVNGATCVLYMEKYGMMTIDEARIVSVH